MVRAHATYAEDPDTNPGQSTFVECHIPLSLSWFSVSPLSIKVYMFEKNLKNLEGKFRHTIRF